MVVDSREKSYDGSTCNICGSKAVRLIYSFPAFSTEGHQYQDVDIVRCSGCGIRRRRPGVKDSFEDGYHEKFMRQGCNIHPHMISFFADLMTERLSEFEQPPGKFLDVGCSTGRALRLALALGMDVTGYDISTWATGYCVEQGFKAEGGCPLYNVFGDESFDVVHCSHVLEHVPDPLCFLAELRRITRTSGYLMIAIPNYASLPRLVKGRAWPIWCLDSHLWFFTRRQIVKLLTSQGFMICRARTLHGYIPDRRWIRPVLDCAAQLGFGDALNIVARKT